MPKTKFSDSVKSQNTEMQHGSLQFDKKTITLSVQESQLLEKTLISFRQKQKLAGISQESYMTTQEAAYFLNVSRPYLVKLLDNGEIPFIKVGNRRRVLESDISAYKIKRDSVRRETLREFSAGLEEDGLYDLDYDSIQSILNDSQKC